MLGSRVILAKSKLFTFLLIFALTTFMPPTLPSQIPFLTAANGLSSSPVAEQSIFEQLTDGHVVQLQLNGPSLFLSKDNDNSQQHRIKLTINDLRDRRPADLRSPILISTFSGSNGSAFSEQPTAGTAFDRRALTFMVKVNDSSILEYVFNIYARELDNRGSALNAVGTATLILGNSKSNGHLSLRVVDPIDRTFTGVLKVDFLVIKSAFEGMPGAAKLRSALGGRGAEEWQRAKSQPVIHSGHRGLGVGVRSDLGSQLIMENTIASFNYAAKSGADMVELDVSLDVDKKVIVYHDLELIKEDNLMISAIKDLTEEKLKSNEYQPVIYNRNITDPMRFNNSFQGSFAPFPSLNAVLERVEPKMQINIEIKFPYLSSTDSWFPYEHFDINEYLDSILRAIIESAGDRQLLLTSFDPSICTALRLKQTKYPILYLTRGDKGFSLAAARDPRTAENELALNFAAATKLAGLNIMADYIYEKNMQVIADAHKLGMKLFAWLGSLTVENANKLIDGGVDGLCYDLIDKKKPLIKQRSSHLITDSRKDRISDIMSEISSLRGLQ